MLRRPRLTVATLVASLTLVPLAGSASAQTRPSAADSAKADQLFEEGTKLFDAGKYAEACEKLDASQKLDPALGTQFNLAECWQRTGRLARARAQFEEVTKIAHATGKADIEQRARDRLTKLTSETPMITVTTTASSKPDTLTLDGAAVSEADFARGVFVDPGEHVVEASARGKTSFRNALTLAAGARSSITVPPLGDDGSVAAGAGGSSSGGSQRTIAITTLAVGGVGIVLGSIFGIVSLGKNGDAKDLCPDASRCSSREGFDAWNDARSAGNISTVAFIVGGVAVAAGAALWLTAPKNGNASVGLTPGGAVARLTW